MRIAALAVKSAHPFFRTLSTTSATEVKRRDVAQSDPGLSDHL